MGWEQWAFGGRLQFDDEFADVVAAEEHVDGFGGFLEAFDDGLEVLGKEEAAKANGRLEKAGGPFGALDPGNAAGSAQSPELDRPEGIASKRRLRRTQIEDSSWCSVCRQAQRRSVPSHRTKH